MRRVCEICFNVDFTEHYFFEIVVNIYVLWFNNLFRHVHIIVTDLDVCFNKSSISLHSTEDLNHIRFFERVSHI